MVNIKHAILSTDVAVLTTDGESLKVLLTRTESGPFKGEPTLPGGLIRPKEKISEAADRFIGKVLKTKAIYKEQLYTFGHPARDPGGRVVAVCYLALIPWNRARLATKVNARWVAVNKVPKLAYDHNEVVETAVERLEGKLSYTNIVFALMPEQFTFGELQEAYEAILGRQLDKRNFRKKITLLSLLRKLPKKRRGDANRPAQLHTFKEKRLRLVEVL